jgi:hypothetical protein
MLDRTKLNGGALKLSDEEIESLWITPNHPQYPQLEERQALRAEDEERARTEKQKRLAKRFAICPLDKAAKAFAAMGMQQAMVWLYLTCQLAIHGNPVKVPNGDLEQWGVDRKTKGRALRSLEAAGLITMKVQPGRAPVVTVIDP